MQPNRPRRESRDGATLNSGDDMGSLDRLDSFDDDFMLSSPPDSPQTQQRLLQPTTPQHPPSDMYNYYAGSSAGHGHVHGNARMSTSNISVNRSNSVTGTSRPYPATQRDIEELMKMDEKDFNLSELFLKKDERGALNKNFEAKGALKGHDKELHKVRSNSISSSFLSSEHDFSTGPPQSKTGDFHGSNNNSNAVPRQISQTEPTGNRQNTNSRNNSSSMDFDLDLDIDPTPLSEIRRKNEEQLRAHQNNRYSGPSAQANRSPGQPQSQHQQQQQRSAGTNSGASSSEMTSLQLQNHQYQQSRQDRRQHSTNYYPYGRSHQLPIPTMPLTAANSSEYAPAPAPMADALATAAAIASTQDSNGRTAASAPSAPQYSQQQDRTSPHSPHSSPHLQPSSHHSSRQTSQGSHHSGASNTAASHTSPQQSPAPTPPTQYPGQHQPHQQHQSHQHPPSHAPNSHAYMSVPHHMPPGSMPPPHIVPGQKIVGPYTSAQQENAGGNSLSRRKSRGSTNTTPAATAPAPPAQYLPRRGDHTGRDASTAHTTPKGVLDEAATQRRGYSGFHKTATSQTTTNYHPVPPSYTSSGPPSTIYAKKAGITYPPQKVELPQQVKPYTNGSSYAVPPAASSTPQESAYERKKQRAKDARVKLNESIDSLHIAMSVAGTESKKRATHLRDILEEIGKSTESSTDHQAFELMETCVKTAESAKKWDRPNFVGTAATLIQCLNSQCEILMKELAELHQTSSSERRKRAATAPVESDTPPEGAQKSDGDNAAGELPEKRRRLNGTYDDEEKKDAIVDQKEVTENKVTTESDAVTMYVPAGGPPIGLKASVVDHLAGYLDPVSQAQCLQVCKSWREEGRFFSKDETWKQLCVKRFGVLRTRQWEEQLSDDEDENCETMEAKSMQLYKAMNNAFVMPPLSFENTAKVLLGQARLPNNSVTAWTFLIERSNGETQRSVKRNPAEESQSDSTGAYASIPVVELRTVIQNTGGRKKGLNGMQGPLIIKEQLLSVDASTRRRGEELSEIDWDERFKKQVLNLDGSVHQGTTQSSTVGSCSELARLGLFDAVVLVTYIHARRCSTTSKFIQRSNFTKVLVSVNGTTTDPLVIPFSKGQQ